MTTILIQNLWETFTNISEENMVKNWANLFCDLKMQNFSNDSLSSDIYIKLQYIMLRDAVNPYVILDWAGTFKIKELSEYYRASLICIQLLSFIMVINMCIIWGLCPLTSLRWRLQYSSSRNSISNRTTVPIFTMHLNYQDYWQVLRVFYWIICGHKNSYNEGYNKFENVSLSHNTKGNIFIMN